MAEERRVENRSSPAGIERGEITVVLAGRELPVRAVVDVAPSGVGLLIDEAVSVGVALEVRYRNMVVDIHLPGSTVWSRPRDEDGRGGHALGIQLEHPALLHTFL